MREAHPVEAAVGMRYYVSDTDGVGGRLRDRPSDFRVRERESFDVDLQPPGAEAGSYPHLVFRARLAGWDTNDFASALSSKLSISRERVSWAGTKDKHAVTTQLFSVRLAADDLPTVADADLEVLGRAGRPVLFGDLAGNDFEIVVREPDRPADAEPIAAELRGLGAGEPTETVAVPNYFGQQRFGSKRPITHRVGLDIVRGEWESAAVRYVCEASDREPVSTRRAREYLAETREWTAAADRLPSHLGYERAIASRLADGADTPADYRAALETLPTNLQTMFVNAAQSYAFNLMLSARLERGLPLGRPIVGDVVCFTNDDGLPDPGRTQLVDSDRLASVRRHCERGRAFVTAPLVGTDTEIGDGEPPEIARHVLSELEIGPGDFDLPGAFDSGGTRRAVCVRTDLELAFEPLTLEFSLPNGSYATALAREFLKTGPEALH